MERDRTIEILLASIFIVLLLIFVTFFLAFFTPKTNSHTTSNTISDYNKDYYIYDTYNRPENKNCYTVKVPYTVRVRDSYNDYGWENQHYYENDPVRPLKYSSRATHSSKEGTFGNDINTFKIYVRNRDHIGGYFTVRYYFEDYYGHTRTEKITKYIPAGKEASFFYQDVRNNEQYQNWRYKVLSENKAYDYDDLDYRDSNSYRYETRYRQEVKCYWS